MPHPSRIASLNACVFFIVLVSSFVLPGDAQSAPARRLRHLELTQLSESIKTSDGSAQAEKSSARRVKLHMSRAKAEQELQASTDLHQRSATNSQLPKPSGWFGSFSEGESTFTEEGVLSSPENPEFYVQNGGKDPAVPYPFLSSVVRDSDYFHESESAGPLEAWQTHFPVVNGAVAGNRNIRNGKWMYTPNGWVQDYVTQDEDPRTFTGDMPSQPVNLKDPKWFDNEVQQYDGFGRYKLPKQTSGLYYADMGWKERSVNTTLTCKDPGCVANVSIAAFDASKEEARNCRLSVDVHPTDYDDDYSQEIVTYLKINGAVAARNCHPKARGCNSTAEKPMFPCLNSFAVDSLIDSAGTLVVEGKISHWVDECPYNDNLLSGVVMVTCMVRPPPVLLAGGSTGENITTTTTVPAELQPIQATGDLRCDFPGCEAKTMLQFSPALALNGGKCMLSVNVTQTDYDDNLGLPEDVEYIQVSGVNATKGPVSPGKNPCTADFQNKSLTEEEKIFSVLKDFDVTQMIQESHPVGTLLVSGKISTQVDECGVDGYLLYGTILLDCQPPKST